MLPSSLARSLLDSYKYLIYFDNSTSSSTGGYFLVLNTLSYITKVGFDTMTPLGASIDIDALKSSSF